MAKTVTLTAENKEYVLEFNLRTVQKLDALGFDYQTAGAHIPVSLPLLFYGAFLLHHSYMRKDQTDNILFSVVDKNGLYEALYGMYIEAISCLVDDPEENEKNSTWKMGDWPTNHLRM